MKKFHHIWIELYETNIYWVKCSWTEYKKLVKKVFDENVKEKESGGKFEVYIKEGQDICVIWLPYKAPVSVIAHECFHAVYYILMKRGLWLTDSSDEAYAFLLQFLVKNILKEK